MEVDLKKIGALNILLIIIFSLTLTALSFFCVVNKNFKNTASVINFLTNANVYPNLADLAKITVRNYYAPMLEGNILQLALADKLSETLITPTVIKAVVDPGLKASITFAKQPTSIIDNKVIVDTTLYKQQILQDINNWELPKFVNSGITYFINSLPQNITLMDNQKYPNNILATIIKIRTFINYNQIGLQISWIVLGITLVAVFINNILNIKKLILTLWIGLLVSGILTVVLFVLIPWIISNSVPVPTEASVLARNKLIYDAAKYLIMQIQQLALWYFGFAVILGVIWKFVKLEKLQSAINKVLHKLHIPVLSVRVERL